MENEMAEVMIMKYTTYYEDSQIVTTKHQEQFINNIEKNRDISEIENVSVRKIAFEYAQGSENEEPEDINQPVYSICMKNFDSLRLYLEKKSVQNNVIYKSCEKLNQEEAGKILKGETEWMKDHELNLFRDFHLQYTLNGLKPGYIMQTEREVRGYRDRSFLIINREMTRSAFRKEDFFDRNIIMLSCLSEDKLRLQYKRPVTIPLAIANIIHTSSEPNSRLAYSL